MLPSKEKLTSKGDIPSKSDSLYVVTENGEQCFVWRANQLTYIAQDRHELPQILATKFGPLATKLDLSYNSLTSFENLNLFTNLSELILDNNNLEDEHLDFRLNLRLKTLSLNKNKLVDLFKLINSIKVHYPNLEYLSLIGNPLCPGSVCGSLSNYRNSNPPNETSSSGVVIPASTTTTSSTSSSSTTTTTNLPIFNGGIHGIDELILSSDADGNGGDADSTGCLRKDLSVSDFSQQKYRHFIIYHLPNLRFLDSSPISSGERDEALRRCFWMNRATSIHNVSRDNQVQVTSGERNLVGSRSVEDDNEFRLTIISDNQEQPKGVFSRLAYKYTGKNSEGNRFIRNKDL